MGESLHLKKKKKSDREMIDLTLSEFKKKIPSCLKQQQKTIITLNDVYVV